MVNEAVKCLFPTYEVAVSEVGPDGARRWKIEGVEFLYEGNILFGKVPHSFLPMFYTQTLQGAIYWSLGFVAGGELDVALKLPKGFHS